MLFKSKKFWAILLGLIIAAFLAVDFSWYWLSTGKLTETKRRFFSALPFPAASVNNSPITMQQFLKRYDLAEKYFAQTQIPENLPALILTQMTAEKAQSLLASSLKVSPTSGQILNEYNWEKNNAALSTDFTDQINKLGLTEEEFQNTFVKNEVTLNNLKIYFYSQKDQNKSAYDVLDKINSGLSEGKSFESLAGEYSQDPNSRAFLGSEGLTAQKNLMPEVAAALEGMAEGQMKVVATRFGLEYIKVKAKFTAPEPAWELEHIFIPGSDFQTWLLNQTQNYKIKQIVKL